MCIRAPQKKDVASERIGYHERQRDRKRESEYRFHFDVDICEESLIDHQKIYVGTEQQAQFILEIWLDDLSRLTEPRNSRVPL